MSSVSDDESCRLPVNRNGLVSSPAAGGVCDPSGWSGSDSAVSVLSSSP